MKSRPKRGVFTLARNRAHPPVGVSMELHASDGQIVFRTFCPLTHTAMFQTDMGMRVNGIDAVVFTTWRA